MTVTTNAAVVNYTGNGATTVFPYAFLIPLSTDVTVTLTNLATNVQTVLTTSQYSISGLGSALGGNVTYPLSGSPLAAGNTISIARSIPYLQSSSIPSQGSFAPAYIEAILDRIVMMDQQIVELYNRTLRVPTSDAVVAALANASQRANMGLVFDANGNPAIGLNTTTVAYGKNTIWIPAPAFLPTITNGCALNSIELATNKINIKTGDFDPATAKFAQCMIRMPKSWNAGGLTAKALWSHAATTVNFGVSWGFQMLSLTPPELLDQAFGAAQVLSVTGGTTNMLYETGESGLIADAAAMAKSDTIILQVYRDATNVLDTMAINARLHGVALFYTADSYTDL